MDLESAKNLLGDYLVKGLVSDIYAAEEAYALATQIGDDAAHVNRAGFGRLFYTLQVMLSDPQTLSVTRMFDEQRGKYPVRSIPACSATLEVHGAALAIREPRALIDVLAQSTRVPSDVDDHQALTRAIVEHYREELADPSLTVPLQHLRNSRDKVIAHNEALVIQRSLHPTWAMRAYWWILRSASQRRYHGDTSA